MHFCQSSYAETDESQQLQICRVLCIFFMMSVHVNPGMGAASVVSVGDFAWLGNLWGNFLGRASVAALSFFSGYLIIRTASAVSLADVARRRFGTLIVPMLVWNLIFCLLLIIKVRILDEPSNNPIWKPDVDLLALLTGLTGRTANESLFFLRDMFVALLIVKFTAPWLRRWPLLVLGGVLVVTLFHLTAPLIFRPSILFFVAAGAVCAQRTDRLAELMTLRRMIIAAAIIIAALAALSTTQGAMAAEAKDLLRRSLLVLLMLSVSAALTNTLTGQRIADLESRIFEAYLLHVPLIGVLWLPWTALIGGPEDTSYLFFFLGMPVGAMVAGRAFGQLCDRLPASAQRLLRGKARPPQRPTLEKIRS